MSSTHLLPLPVVAAGLLCATACSDNGVSGRVVDGFTAEPVADLELGVAGTQFRTKTDASGTYEFVDIPAGPQKIEVLGTGYVEQKRLEVTVGDDVVPAADYVVFPAPEQPGMYFYKDSTFTPIPNVLPHAIPTKLMGPLTGWLPEDVKDVPEVPIGALLLRYQADQPGDGWEVDILEDVREHRRQGFGLVEYAPAHSRLKPAENPGGVRVLAPNLLSVEVPRVPDTVFFFGRGENGAIAYSYLFRFAAEPVTFKDRGGTSHPVIPVGHFGRDTPQFEAVREYLVGYCEGPSAAAECPAALPFLKKIPPDSPNCPAYLASDAKGYVAFTAVQCDDRAVRIDFDRNDDDTVSVRTVLVVDSSWDMGD